MSVRKARFSGHEALNSVVRADWMKAIELSPDAFEAFLYRPVEPSGDSSDGDAYQEEVALELDVNQDTLTYADPELVKVVDCPDEQESFFLMEDNEGNAGEGVEPLLIRVASNSVPMGSVLEWDEEDANGTRTVWWYVHKSMGFGTANVGVIYICVPMRDFDRDNMTAPVIEEPVIEEVTYEETDTSTAPDDLVYL